MKTLWAFAKAIVSAAWLLVMVPVACIGIANDGLFSAWPLFLALALFVPIWLFRTAFRRERAEFGTGHVIVAVLHRR